MNAFLNEFSGPNDACRDQIRENVLVKQYYCDVDVAHLISYNEELAHKLNTEPAELIPLVCASTDLTMCEVLIGIPVRSSIEEVHTTHSLPLPKGHLPP
jgi:hypothetical protein